MKKIYFLVLALGFFTSVNAQIINIPDANFKHVLLFGNDAYDSNGSPTEIDLNGDNEIDQNEALNIYQLYIHNQSISDLTGIEYFSNLLVFACNNNQITSLNAAYFPNLYELYCEDNMISVLSITNCPNLNILQCDHNNLSVLNTNGLHNLQTLLASQNNLTSLDVSDSPNLTVLECAYNQLTSLDLSNNFALDEINCSNNLLETLNMKNGHNDVFGFGDNPNLQYICADESEMTSVQEAISYLNYVNCNLNSYCSFTPGGTFYTLQGNNRLDGNTNGCDASDSVFPNLKFNITDGTISGGVITDSSGNYSIPVQEGTHVVTPFFENPNYFNVSPASLNVTFPTQTSPLTQNFCITPNGTHQDLEVVLLPIVPSRPGFDAKFKIIYKNKGTNVQSGSVVIDYFDHLVDFVSSVPAVTSDSANLLTWNYTNLQPFETREITFIVNINSPVETPAVNIGDILSFESYIYPVIGDLTTSDNHSGFRQVVVGSYDPNDKTCLEGEILDPAKVGEYVHYMIRFENTGTYPAENIVVKDMIDADKFDINSLVVMKGSHSFVTRITETNKVEFIFENINLPFDDANNDGYVAFKIKTQPTLVLGNTFSNTASIYFDYNFPIVTNTATTTIAALSRQDFEFADYFNVYPNPVKDILNISATATIEVSSINVYNTLGQLILVIPNAKDIKTVDVSGLVKGNYFIKIHSDKGVSNTKFIKN